MQCDLAPVPAEVWTQPATPQLESSFDGKLAELRKSRREAKEFSEYWKVTQEISRMEHGVDMEFAESMA